jgi:bifunctional non-homologous end joining protein LigD
VALGTRPHLAFAHADHQRHITANATEEIKFDGFRALTYIEEGKCRLVSRRRHEYQSFRELQASIAGHLPVKDAVIDGEIVCLDHLGRSQFYELMFRRGDPFFYAFDFLWLNGRDLRGLPLLERKQSGRRLDTGQELVPALL